MLLRDLRNPWPPDAPWVANALLEAEVDEVTLLLDSSNYVFLASLTHEVHGAGLAIYKPARGERPLSDFPYGTLHRREVGAYEVSRTLGWDMVPPTVERDGPAGVGSMQLFVEHDPTEHYFDFREDSALHPQLVRIAVFDLITNNADRKGGHVLRGPGGRLWAIDNGLCFHRQEKLRTVIWDFADTSVPEDLRGDLERLCTALDDGDAEADGVRQHLGPGESEALSRRVKALLGAGALPQMYPWRCTPWPLI
jgi:uncharacterized repeat protein (TIGR03843 family)